MRNRWRRALPLVTVGTGAAGLALVLSCNDFLSGQAPEPSGPLQITRVTLLDRTSRSAAVFTDTLVPLDCDLPAYKDSRGCQSDPLRDRYSKQKSPPTPDSASELRVVFNKLPLLLDGQDTEAALRNSPAITLSCEGCQGAPPLLQRVIYIGTELSADPLTSPYGPALLAQVDPSDGRAALEPETAYRVVVAPGLAGRDGAKVDLGDKARLDPLLTFTTEPFKVLKVGVGAASDPFVYAAGQPAGTAESPFKVAALSNDGVVALQMNAPLDAATLMAVDSVRATLTVNGVTQAAPVRVTLQRQTTEQEMGVSVTRCREGRWRVIHVAPGRPEGTWLDVGQKGELRLTYKEIRDVSQAMGHPAGKHTLQSRVVVAALSGALATPGTLVYGKDPQGTECAIPATAPTDMASPADMASPSDGGRD